MNEERRQKLIDRMKPVKSYGGGIAPISMPLVGLEEYFQGADGEAGLLCNSSAEPDNDTVLDVFRSIRERPEVHDIRIAITQCDDGEWPFSDKVVVVTNADDETVMSWLPEGFEPDEVWEGYVDHLKSEVVAAPPGYRAVWLWYD
jgi:hypothetical protein